MLQDLDYHMAVGVSIAPGATGDANGSYVDCGETDGNLTAICQNGAATGTPDNYGIAWSVYEADDKSGTGAQAIAGATGSLAVGTPANNDRTHVNILVKNRSKRFLQVRADATISGGSTPTVPLAAVIVGRKRFPGTTVNTRVT